MVYDDPVMHGQCCLSQANLLVTLSLQSRVVTPVDAGLREFRDS
jgi:hypothetical protein